MRKYDTELEKLHWFKQCEWRDKVNNNPGLTKSRNVFVRLLIHLISITPIFVWMAMMMALYYVCLLDIANSEREDLNDLVMGIAMVQLITLIIAIVEVGKVRALFRNVILLKNLIKWKKQNERL